MVFDPAKIEDPRLREAALVLATFRGRFVEVTTQIEDLLDTKLGELYLGDLSSPMAKAFEKVLLSHRDITFRTKIDLLRDGATSIGGYPPTSGLVNRLENHSRHRNRLAHVRWSSIEYSDDDPSQVNAVLEWSERGKGRTEQILMDDQETWMAKAGELFQELLEFSPVIEQSSSTSTESEEK